MDNQARAIDGRVLYLVICAAGPASRIDNMVRLAQVDGWDVYCIATPAAVEHFLDLPALSEMIAHPVLTSYRTSRDEPLPKADAVIVAPATYNTINKWAAGIADNYVLNQLAELTGLGLQPGLPAQHARATPSRRPRPVRARGICATSTPDRGQCAGYLSVAPGNQRGHQ